MLRGRNEEMLMLEIEVDAEDPAPVKPAERLVAEAYGIPLKNGMAADAWLLEGGTGAHAARTRHSSAGTTAISLLFMRPSSDRGAWLARQNSHGPKPRVLSAVRTAILVFQKICPIRPGYSLHEARR